LYSLTAVPMKRSAKSGAETLPTQATAWPPAARMAATVSSAGSASRSLTTMRAPSDGELERDRAADAAARAGDEGDLAFELECHVVFRCFVVSLFL
jgi:hypothetical protein